MLSCSFFGHREIEIDKQLKIRLKEILTKKIVEESYSIFYFGGFGEFDELCYQIITELKIKYPHIKRVFCLTDYKQQTKKPKWLKDEDYEDIVYFELQFNWWYQRIYYRNLEIINNSDFIVFFVQGNRDGGAQKAMKYAISKKKDIINLAD